VNLVLQHVVLLVAGLHQRVRNCADYIVIVNVAGLKCAAGARDAQVLGVPHQPVGR